MNKGKRVHLVQKVRDVMSTMSYDDEELPLTTFEIGRRPEDNGFGPTLTSWLNEADDDNLIALGQHLEVLDNTTGHTVEPSQQVEPEPGSTAKIVR